MKDKKDTRFEKITMEERHASQHNDALCSEISRRLNEGEKSSFKNDDDGLLIRTIYADLQIAVPHTLKKRVIYISHYPVIAGHPGGRQIYYRIRHHFYWPALAADCYSAVHICPEFSQNLLKHHKNVGERPLFPSTAPFESVCLDILGELVRTPRGHRYVISITH